MNASFVLSSLLKDNQRIHNKIDRIIAYLQSSRTPLHEILSTVPSPSSPIQILKILILLHSIIFLYPSLLQIQQTSQFLSQITCKVTDNFEKMIQTKVISQYSLYLQKKMYDNFPEESTFQNLMYMNLNLLQRSLGFVEIIYTFGRYYSEKYQFGTDLCIVLGKDVKMIYENIGYLLKKVREKQNILLELEKLHERMYIIFYNCYYNTHLKRYIPKWIQTESLTKLQQTKLNKSSSTMHSSCEKGGQSSITSEHDVSQLEESTMTLIKDLQKIIPQ